MTYELFSGEPAYSSWSLRAWLLFNRFDLQVRTTWVDFLDNSVAAQMAAHPPARTVPALRLPDGTIVWDSLALAEELASRHPEAGFWPSNSAARAVARSLAAEMHCSFSALRNDCPMNLCVAYRDTPASDGLRADIDRIEDLWAHARAKFGAEGPWLCGSYSIADAFFAPVAARIAGYGLAISEASSTYVDAHLNDLAFRRWRALAVARGVVLPWYSRDYPRTEWPGPATRPARAVSNGPSVNAVCPFSGKPVTHFAEVDGQTIGFCNPTCRDKVVADADAWPQLQTINQI
ncbi:glutathione S-transferase [Tropicimonas marinistellae]|uniref:glutathione S-transferase n=1 Tax=Tropicimonas marinistellae TaxID=1739787 RepID=UPI000833C51E|nr:glutathione S-transferase [Tropicimonas marinistellae]